MAYCRNCGNKLNNDDCYCSECGEKFQATENIEQERKEQYIGVINKCPNCGEIIKSFVSTCPSCGLEFRGIKATSSIKELSNKLETIESKRHLIDKKRLLFKGSISKTDEQKINLIRNFSIPNTKEDLLEFMILASSNIDFSIYGWGDKGIITESRKAVSEAWISKMKQVYEKSKLSISETEEFKNIERLYLDKTKTLKRKRSEIWKTSAIIYAIFFIIIGAIIVFSPEETLEDKINSRQNHLEFVVKQIEDNIAEGKFTEAENKAYTLTFDEELDEDKHSYWEKKKNEILKQIKEARDR